MNKIHKIKVIGTTFEGYYYDENDNKVEVDGEFDIFGMDVRVTAIETNSTSIDISDIVDTDQIEEAITSQIDTDAYKSDYYFEED